jgi:hypothetical protein
MDAFKKACDKEIERILKGEGRKTKHILKIREKDGTGSVMNVL